MKLVVDESLTSRERKTVQSVPLQRSTARDVAELSGFVHVNRTLPATVEATTSFDATKEAGGVTSTVVVSTGAGVVSTGATVVSTGATVVSTGASVVSTGATVVSTGASVVSTGASVVSTGGTVVSTGGSTGGGRVSGGGGGAGSPTISTYSSAAEWQTRRVVPSQCSERSSTTG